MKLLEKLVNVHAPSGEEFRMKEFLLQYIEAHSKNWTIQPKLIHGEEFHDALILVFGEPRTVIFAHTDTIGFTVRYDDQLVPIGGPEADSGFELTGEDTYGPIDCKLDVRDGQLYYDFPRAIQRGTSLVFKSNFRLTSDFVQSPYMDNRLGVYNALKVAETLENGVIVFSTYEEHGGGSVPFILNNLLASYAIKQALISDITWVTEGVRHGEGVAISLRDKNIPRKIFIDRILKLAAESKIPYQLEVEGAGSSDGREVQVSPFAIDWCFIGAPEHGVHSPNEIVHLDDIKAMTEMYQYLMMRL